MEVNKMDLGRQVSQSNSEPLSERQQKLAELQEATYRDMLSVLEQYGLCNIERPTGFGKTKQFMDLVKQYPDESFIYVYDVNSVVEDIMDKYYPENIEFMSYTNLSRKDKQDSMLAYICQTKRKAVIFDESHLMGGSNISEFVQRLIPLCKQFGVWVLGGTATPLRLDLIDVTDKFFEGHRVFEYTLEDAIEDKIMLAPHWVVTVHVQQLLQQLRVQVSNNGFQIERIRQLDRAYTKILDVDKVYRKGIEDAFGQIPDHMQFIAFYPTIESLMDGQTQIYEDFKKAFPEHKIKLYAITSYEEHFSDIVSLKDSIIYDSEKTVVIIMAVNMLNQAYHSEDLTGLIMNRATESNRIFTQQLGRGLSVMAKQRIVVFDNVGNARISPDAFISNMEALEKVSSGKYKSSFGTRNHNSFIVNAQPEVLDLLGWYQRIKATSALTQEQIDYAKMLRSVKGAPIEFIEKFVHVPKWVVDENK